MSTAAIESSEPTSSPRRSTTRGGGRSAQARSRAEIDSSVRHAESAVTELVQGSVEAVHAFLPTALTRPTDAVGYVFDLAEQALVAARRLCFELASVVESGFEGMERSAA